MTVSEEDEVRMRTSKTLPSLVPPLNFGLVVAGVFRSGHPNRQNFEFLDTLGLRSIMYLADETYRSDTSNWATARGLKIMHFRMEQIKEPWGEIDEAMMAEAVSFCLDTRNLPLLVHCNKGKSRVGLLCAILRRVQGISLTSAYDEFSRFFGAAREGRAHDLECIETFNVSSVMYDPQYKPTWLLQG
ncbi:uncharacterized protein L969DRAFT_97328 [Mixia osmundae IAM 14324]|uniref:Tyrosine specific protein phosphatases domain-containing protein n=1 Tax=Mixia osmundae (strain CBS 9802 / IAM 14324 / JCM 22182 / KY 12970) TaxID=764103 RepID=G7DV56_MIXOS|nr:uncharacterized protein L969DRAFT_97328 [Mixia osmundae IAM 14324]KEI36317.1 hypothetical protein L969DRAFT_97328 [Mixia osmundae IAM 14324]GAA94466.1 hypothetical protein E5Q_01118 [Mixia osmundae IAM 14324]